MICLSCREGVHVLCPEIERQQDMTLGGGDRAGSAWCYCQHEAPADVADGVTVRS